MELYNELLAAIKEHSELDDTEIIDAGTHGADAGWSGFTYNEDAANFYDANEENIYELLNQTADEMGYKSVDALVATFTRSDMLATPEGRKVLLAWFALEEVGRWLENQKSEVA
jgi:hypothetical protein